MRGGVWVLCVLCCVIGCYSASYWNTTVTIPNVGTLNGYVDPLTKVNAFLGIPFAQNPSGNLRWKPPVPVTSYPKNPYSATTIGRQCPQGQNAATQNEDCLTLNIYAPDTPGNKSVFFWIHGGAFSMGTGGLYYGGFLAAKNIVVVTINYRLGALGFLSHPLLYAESRNTYSGNYGLLDQRLALQWVVDNIHLFGGKNDDITIAGESAGAASVVFHLSHNLAYPNEPSSKAVTKFLSQSTSGYAQILNLNASYQTGINTQKQLNCSDLACMRSASLSKILAVNLFVTSFATIDGGFLVNYPYITINSASQSAIRQYKYLFGTNAREGDIFIYPVIPLPVTSPNYPVALFLLSQNVPGAPLSEAAVSQLIRVYPCPENSSDCRVQLADMYGDFLFVCSTDSIARTLQADYVYKFTLPPATHAAELVYVFGFGNGSSSDVELGEAMHRYWANFVSTGSVNSGENVGVVWPSFVGQSGQYSRLELNSVVRVIGGYDEGVCKFWGDQYELLYTGQNVEVGSVSGDSSNDPRSSGGSNTLESPLLLFSHYLKDIF